jgi:site-specific DNA recombinase
VKVVGYMRLSRDEDKESYSSIISQKSIIDEYAVRQNWQISKYYIDDNCSGYSFERPAFKELLEDLENNCIDVIIAKDLSRIGRHNANTLLFLDKVKRLGKRLILPKEGRGYDTAEDESDLLGITTWYNEMYVKDISRKIKGSIKSRQREGRMLIKEAFGYKKSKTDKHLLELDIEAAAIVRKIFDLYLSGYGYRKIAEILNHEGYPTPSQYRQYSSSSILKTAAAWSSVHVQRILKNDLYIGTLRLGKTEKKVIKGRSEKQPENLQFVFENNHPPIVSRQQFEEVQRIASHRRVDSTKGTASLQNLFAGMLFCRECGSNMIAYKRAGKHNVYICGGYHRYGRKVCTRHTVREDLLVECVQGLIKLLISCNREVLESILLSSDNLRSEIDNQLLNKLLDERKKCKQQIKQVILQRIKEMDKEHRQSYRDIIAEGLDELEEDLSQRLIYLENSIDEIQQRAEHKAKESALDNAQRLDKIVSGELCKKHLEVLIDKILIDSEGTPTIYIKADLSTICYHNREDVNWVPDL